jgi:hypothetical protein
LKRAQQIKEGLLAGRVNIRTRDLGRDKIFLKTDHKQTEAMGNQFDGILIGTPAIVLQYMANDRHKRDSIIAGRSKYGQSEPKNRTSAFNCEMRLQK